MPSITLATPISPEGWAETLIGGQCFRWRSDPEKINGFRGQIDGHALTLSLSGSKIFWDQKRLSARSLKRYLAIDTQYADAWEALPWRSDPQLKSAMDAFQGLRILRQPVEEVLFCFLCSSVKSIPQIKQMLESVCRDFGDPIEGDQYSFPGWDTLREIGETPLRERKLGYRAKFIAQTASRVSSDYFETLKSTDYANARTMLMDLPGVGEKIADCVSLFGLGHLEAFPVDTWIAQAMQNLYALDGWTLPQVAQFGRTHFGAYAGLAQQFLFSFARSR
ncbi:MAG: DNA glycosylase [Verrucomicrobiota bacterium]